jgi:hypothetical protein
MMQGIAYFCISLLTFSVPRNEFDVCSMINYLQLQLGVFLGKLPQPKRAAVYIKKVQIHQSGLAPFGYAIEIIVP